MAIPDLTAANLGHFEGCIGALLADTPRLWGEMDALRMARHLRHTVEVSLEEVDAPDDSTLFSRTFLRVFAFHVMTRWPKGRLKAPAYWFPAADRDFEAERDALLAAVRRFVEQSEQTPSRLAVSPLLGPISLQYWGHVHGVHMNHHFRQFGLVDV